MSGRYRSNRIGFLAAVGQMTSASFPDHIKGVLRMITQEQVIGSNASAIVASVAHQLTFWYRAIGKFIGVSMRPDVLTMHKELPIAILANVASPQPAPIGGRSLIYGIPKAYNDGHFTAGLRFWRGCKSLSNLAVHAPLMPRQIVGQGLPTSASAQSRGNCYNIHAVASYQVIATPRPLREARGLSMPNYSTSPMRVLSLACLARGGE